ncbi:hypothetical protein LCGC14_2227090, partial [marine sediment metagenome]
MTTLEELSRSLGLLKARLPIRALRHLTEGHIHNLAKHIGGDTWLRILDRNLATVDIVNNADPQTIYSYSIGAGVLGATGGVALKVSGDYLNNAGGANTLIIRILLGATTVFTSNAFNLNAGPTRRKWVLVISFNNAATAAQKWDVFLLMGPDNAANFAVEPTGTFNVARGAGSVPSAEDTSAARTISVRVEHGVAHALLS